MTRITLRFRDLTRHFGRVRALSGATGAAGPGEALLVRGPNGSGKSTLLRCLAGLLRPDRGEIEAREGERLLTAEERRRHLAYLAPGLGYYRELTVLENLTLLARVRHLPGEVAHQSAELFGLPPTRRAGELSSGLLQRLRWAGALLHRPTLWLLDEPFEHLDGPSVERCRGLLAEHLEAGGVAVVASPTRLGLPGRVHELLLAD